jgi:putative hemolysin
LDARSGTPTSGRSAAWNPAAGADADPLRVAEYPRSPERVPAFDVRGGSYRSRFARDAADVRSIQRLRFEVFNLELEEGLDESYRTGLDQDPYDAACHHIVVQHESSGATVGTYRLQTRDMARDGQGWYTASEFDLSRLSDAFFDAAVEAGRACVAREHRNGRVLNHLWRAIAAYLVHNHKRYLFGCCSLTSQDPHVAKATHDFLRSGDFVRDDLRIRVLPDYRCYEPGFAAAVDTPVELPPLFAGYLKLGAKIVGEPALDRQFKTIDFLALLDVADLDPHTYRTFFPR